jgi:hypothetical protein
VQRPDRNVSLLDDGLQVLELHDVRFLDDLHLSPSCWPAGSKCVISGQKSDRFGVKLSSASTSLLNSSSLLLSSSRPGERGRPAEKMVDDGVQQVKTTRADGGCCRALLEIKIEL